jgi:hypothetical protein
MDREVSSSRARGYLRQLVRRRWLAACIGAALLYSAHTALDIEIPAVPVLGVLALYALLNAATVQRLHGTWPRFWSHYWPVTERERSLEAMAHGGDVERLGTFRRDDSYFGPIQRAGTMVQIELPLYRDGKQERGEDDDYRGLRIA